MHVSAATRRSGCTSQRITTRRPVSSRGWRPWPPPPRRVSLPDRYTPIGDRAPRFRITMFHLADVIRADLIGPVKYHADGPFRQTHHRRGLPRPRPVVAQPCRRWEAWLLIFGCASAPVTAVTRSSATPCSQLHFKMGTTGEHLLQRSGSRHCHPARYRTIAGSMTAGNAALAVQPADQESTPHEIPKPHGLPGETTPSLSICRTGATPPIGKPIFRAHRYEASDTAVQHADHLTRAMSPLRHGGSNDRREHARALVDPETD